MIYFKRSWKKFLFYCDIIKKGIVKEQIHTLLQFGFHCCRYAFKVRALGLWTCLYIWSPYTVRLFMVSKSSFSQWNMRNNHVHMKSPCCGHTKTYHLFVILKCPFYGNTYGLLTKCEVKMARYWPSSNIHFIGDHAMSWRYWIPACPSDDKQFSYFTCPCHYVIGQVLFLRVYGARWSWGP